ncbi:MAG: hypothetical protein ACREIJ_05105 [Nitrospiraceae bacterium]
MSGRLLANFSLYHPVKPSCGTDDARLFLQQFILFPQRWRMAQHTTAEDQVIDMLHRVHACDLEEVTRQCANLTWNQVFLAVDRLSRSGEIMLVPRGRGAYAVTFPPRQEGRPDRRSLPS